ncbi:MAG: hypothetical protein ISS19_16950, partial [Bacteroidales bacterium]|nr:hypothetical protein [Bacteroidales bacterium]
MKVLKVSLQVAFSICLSFFAIKNSIAQTTIEVSGSISDTTTWSYDTVKVTGDIIVENGVTLTISPGTYVEFQGHYELLIKGNLIAKGEVNDTIIFTISDTTGFADTSTVSGGWHRIRFADQPFPDNSDSSFIELCIIEYGKAKGPSWFDNSGGAIFTDNHSKLVISNCIIENNYAHEVGGAIFLHYASPLIINNIIKNNTSQ